MLGGLWGGSIHRCQLPNTWSCVLQLDQICISFDEGKTTMNFIEAALLIQGSACVYSKKVGTAWLRVSWTEVHCPAGAGGRLVPVCSLLRQRLLSPQFRTALELGLGS